MMEDITGATDEEPTGDELPDGAFALSSAWLRVCVLCQAPSICLSTIAVPLCRLSCLLPPRFSRYCQQLIGLTESSQGTGSPPALRQQRDVLPLPFSELSIDRLMKDSGGGSTAELRASRRAWLFLMCATLNYHWGLGTAQGARGVIFGPPSSIQLAALLKLVGPLTQWSGCHHLNSARSTGPMSSARLGTPTKVSLYRSPKPLSPHWSSRASPLKGSLGPSRSLFF